jgi:2-dehydropantoate 2-reductase
MSNRRPRFLVVGAGGIGGIVAAHLIEQDHDVTTLTTNPVIADAINASGFRVRGEASPGDVRGRTLLELPGETAPFDYVLLATQPPQVEAAAKGVLSRLAGDGHMVCFQNGLIEERIAKICGTERVIGAVVAWGASMVEPGIYDRTSAGGFQIGHLDASAGGPATAAVQTLASALECIGPTVITQNLLGARWSTLAINCAISSLGTVGGDRLGVLMRQRHVRRLALEIMTEVTQVARASGIRLEKVAGTLDLEWISLTDADKQSAGSASLIAKHALLLAVGARYRRLRSSMLAAIERGRTPSVEFLNGDIVTRGKALDVPTPINAAIRDEILKIAAGKAKSSHELLRSFFDRTRTLVSASEPASVRPAASASQEAGTPAPPSKTIEAAPLDASMKSAPPPSAAAPSAGAAAPADTIVDPKSE